MNIPKIGEVTILGQPKIKGWFLCFNLECPAPCGRTVMVVGGPGAQQPCECGRVYRVMGMPTLQADHRHIDVPLIYAEAKRPDEPKKIIS